MSYGREEIVSNNWYVSNRLMITSGEFWRCKHGCTHLNGKGCVPCKEELPTLQFDDTTRLSYLLAHHATVETDGEGNWRVAWEWTTPETYFPYAKGRREAIDAAIKVEANE